MADNTRFIAYPLRIEYDFIMASVTKLQEYGNQIAILLSDGTKLLAYPLSTGLWAVNGGGTAPSGATAIWPFDPASVTTEYNGYPGHNGIDFGQAGGTPIPNSVAGTVVTVAYEAAGWGNYVTVESIVGADTLRCLYAHMETAAIVSVNDVVTQGQTLGPVGTTGDSTGNHLHWETTINGVYVNPRDFMVTYG